jgi:hypothetical protein
MATLLCSLLHVNHSVDITDTKVRSETVLGRHFRILARVRIAPTPKAMAVSPSK